MKYLLVNNNKIATDNINIILPYLRNNFISTTYIKNTIQQTRMLTGLSSLPTESVDNLVDRDFKRYAKAHVI
jgi:hypothetical protein